MGGPFHTALSASSHTHLDLGLVTMVILPRRWQQILQHSYHQEVGSVPLPLEVGRFSATMNKKIKMGRSDSVPGSRAKPGDIGSFYHALLESLDFSEHRKPN